MHEGDFGRNDLGDLKIESEPRTGRVLRRRYAAVIDARHDSFLFLSFSLYKVEQIALYDGFPTSTGGRIPWSLSTGSIVLGLTPQQNSTVGLLKDSSGPGRGKLRSSLVVVSQIWLASASTAKFFIDLDLFLISSCRPAFAIPKLKLTCDHLVTPAFQSSSSCLIADYLFCRIAVYLFESRHDPDCIQDRRDQYLLRIDLLYCLVLFAFIFLGAEAVTTENSLIISSLDKICSNTTRSVLVHRPKRQLFVNCISKSLTIVIMFLHLAVPQIEGMSVL